MAIASLDSIKTYLGLKVGSTDNTTSAQAAVLTILHSAAERAIKDYLQQDIEQATYTELLPNKDHFRGEQDLSNFYKQGNLAVRYPISGQNKILQLKHLPVVEDSLQVWEDPGAYASQASGAFSAATLLAKGTDYYLDLDDTGLSRSGQLIRVGNWSAERRTIKVTYKGGWTSAQIGSGGIAEGIRLAAILTVAKAFRQQEIIAKRDKAGPVISESIGKYSYTLDRASVAQMAGMLVTLPAEAILLLQPFVNYRLL